MTWDEAVQVEQLKLFEVEVDKLRKNRFYEPLPMSEIRRQASLNAPKFDHAKERRSGAHR